ncbi:MAG: glucosaminidase domain-containing protein [Prolixibacteraceae bacterium]|nr:glucosaminidase domain-containing protein [Prolixibacteraceae bacterium]
MKIKDSTFLIVSFFIILYAILHTKEVPPELMVKKVKLDSIEQIIDINDSLVVPVIYDTLLIDANAPVKVRKKQFVNQVLPAILIVRYELNKKTERVKSIIQKIENEEPVPPCDSVFIDSLKSRYRAESYQNLVVRMEPNPISLALAQAAIESGWGLSRFAIEGKNLFGVWTVSSDKNIIKSLSDRGEQQIFVKRYNSIAESIDHYFLTLGRHNAYREFRLKRFEQDDVYEMIKELDRYSEQGEAYTLLLKKVMVWNDLQQYDNYSIDPQYIIREKWLKVQLKKILNNEFKKEEREDL